MDDANAILPGPCCCCSSALLASLLWRSDRYIPSFPRLLLPVHFLTPSFLRSSSATRKEQRESRARPWLTGSILAKRSPTIAKYRGAPSRKAEVSPTPPPSSTESSETSLVSVSSSVTPTQSKIPRLRVTGSVKGEKSEGAGKVDDGVPGKGKRGLLTSLLIGASESRPMCYNVSTY